MFIWNGYNPTYIIGFKDSWFSISLGFTPTDSVNYKSKKKQRIPGSSKKTKVDLIELAKS